MLHSPFPDTIYDKEEPSPSVLADRLHSFLLMDSHISLRTPARGERTEGRLLQPPEPVLPDSDRDPAPDLLHHERHLPRRHGTETGGPHLPHSRVFLFLQRLHLPHALRIHGNHDDAKGNVLRAVQPGQVVLPRRPDAYRRIEPYPHEPRDPGFRHPLCPLDLPERIQAGQEMDQEGHRILFRHSQDTPVSRILRLRMAPHPLGERMLPAPRLRTGKAVPGVFRYHQEYAALRQRIPLGVIRGDAFCIRNQIKQS